MKWYDYVMMFVGLVAPIAWQAVKARNPDFPMEQQIFVDTIVYIVGAIFGVKLFKLYLVGIAKGKGMKYEQWIKQ